MVKELICGLILALGLGSAANALDNPPEPGKTPTVAMPVTISSQEIIQDGNRYRLPRPPGKYNDGTDLKLTNEVNEAPRGEPMRILAQPSVAQEVPSTNKKDRDSGKYHWHPYEAWNYCHYHEGDRQWYGWRTGETFHWVLWKSGRFWWHDSYAERWLYFDRGYWWWQGSKKPVEIQVYLEDRHYHACDANGVLGDDLLETGTEEVVGEPVAKTTPYPTPVGKLGDLNSGSGLGHGMGGF